MFFLDPDLLEAEQTYQYNSPMESPSLPLIIAIPAVVVIVIVAIALYVLARRRGGAGSNRPVTTVVRGQNPPGRMPPQLTPQEKMFAEQYTALHPQYHQNGSLNGMTPLMGQHYNNYQQNGLPMVHSTPSRDNFYNMKVQHDHSSDNFSVAKQQQLPPVMQPLTQNQLHSHNMHQQQYGYTDYPGC